MKKYGLIGYPLDHSFSRDYFMNKFRKEALDAIYINYPLRTIEDFPGLIEANPDLKGLNVTLPYKSVIIKYLDDIDSRAASAGAVNVIQFTGTGRRTRLKGFNTDIDGFVLSLKPLLERKTIRALVLGTGGASRAVRAGLDMLGIAGTVVSRDKMKADMIYPDITAEVLKQYGLIINTTPLGMYPDTAKAPAIPYDALGSEQILFDLVYNPEMTLFLRLGQERGCKVKNGLEMLHIQAEKAWEIWNAQLPYEPGD